MRSDVLMRNGYAMAGGTWVGLTVASPKGNRRWTDEELVAAVHAVTKRIGHIPAPGEYERQRLVSEPGAGPIYDRFAAKETPKRGRWATAMDRVFGDAFP